MSKRVLIIGGSGFVGTYVARRLLERGDYIVSLDLKEPSPQLKFVYGDLLENAVFIRGSCTYFSDIISIVEKHDINNIIHLAAIQDLAYANEHPLPVYDLHINGLLNILEVGRILSQGRIVVGSTTGTYTPREYEPMDESHPVYSASTGHLTGHYGGSKAAADIIAMSYFTTNGLDLVIARMSHIYGFGMWSDAYIRVAVENIVKGRSTHYETGKEALFDYTYVEDVADGVIKCLDVRDEQLNQRIFLIANGTLRSGAYAVSILQKLAPELEISIGDGMTERQKVSFRTQLDISNATEQLDYKPQYDLESGIARFIEIQMEFEEWKGKLT